MIAQKSPQCNGGEKKRVCNRVRLGRLCPTPPRDAEPGCPDPAVRIVQRYVNAPPHTPRAAAQNRKGGLPIGKRAFSSLFHVVRADKPLHIRLGADLILVLGEIGLHFLRQVGKTRAPVKDRRAEREILRPPELAAVVAVRKHKNSPPTLLWAPGVKRYLSKISARLLEELRVNRRDSLRRILLFDQNRNLNLTRRNHLDIDVRVEQRLEHIGGDAGVRLHAGADDRDLRDVVVKHDAARAEQLGVRFELLDRRIHLILFDREADVLRTVAADGLEDDIDVDVLLRELRENAERKARLIRNADDRDSGDVVVLGDAADEHFFHVDDLLDNRSLRPRQAGKNL